MPIASRYKRRVPGVGTLLVFHRSGVGPGGQAATEHGCLSIKEPQSLKRTASALPTLRPSDAAFYHIHHKGIIQHQKPQSYKGVDSAPAPRVICQSP
jgi:hypothetical protein